MARLVFFVALLLLLAPFAVRGELVAYEATVNEVLNRGKTPTVCVYDIQRLSGSMMMDLLRAHPLTVMNGMLYENPFYTPAKEMLKEIQQRRASTCLHA